MHVFNQKEQQHAYQTSKGVVTESWGAFAEGKNDVFNHPILKEIAQKHKKTTAQVMLRWQLQRGIVSLSKSANPERVRSNFDIFDFQLTDADMEQIKTINTDTTVFADHHDATTVELLASFIGKSF